MKRIRLGVAYDGTNYSGWQIQPNAPTIEKSLMKLYTRLQVKCPCNEVQAEPMQEFTH